jgi:hypothetical protein
MYTTFFIKPAFLVFSGILPLTFTFTKNSFVLLLDTEWKYSIWIIQIITLAGVIFTKRKWNNKSFMAIAGLYFLIPFTFFFETGSVNFLILNKYISTLMSWGVASLIFIKYFNLKHRASHTTTMY